MTVEYDGRHTLSFSRCDFHLSFVFRWPSLIRGRRESRAPDAPVDPARRRARASRVPKHTGNDYRYSQDIPAHEEGKLNDLRAILGNEIAIKAAREGTLPFPDGAIIARLAWDYHPLEESKQAFGAPQSFVAGPPKNGVQLMVKDTRKYASTGRWGYVEFDNGKPSAKAMPSACFACHSIVKARDFVFNRYAP
jgi:hypothetical protein